MKRQSQQLNTPTPQRKLKKQRCVWRQEEIYKLINVWKRRVNDLRNTKKNRHIYGEIADELNGLGMNTLCEEVHIKIQNLSQMYRSEKRRIDQNGGPPSEWTYYNEVHEILGTVRSEAPEEAVEKISVKCELPPMDDSYESYMDNSCVPDYPNDNSVNFYYSANGSPSTSMASSSTPPSHEPPQTVSQTAPRISVRHPSKLQSIEKENPPASDSGSEPPQNGDTHLNGDVDARLSGDATPASIQYEILKEIKRANALAEREYEDYKYLNVEIQKIEQQRFNLIQIFTERSLTLQTQMLQCLQAQNQKATNVIVRK